MIPLRDMQRTVLASVPRLPVEKLGIREVHGLVLAEDVVAGHDVPPFANSAMDGYAVRGGDVGAAPVTLQMTVEDLSATQTRVSLFVNGSLAFSFVDTSPIQGSDKDGVGFRQNNPSFVDDFTVW